MFKRIIVPLDGGAFAEAALGAARELARMCGSRVVVVRAVAPSGLPRTVASTDTEASFERLDEADAYLHDVVDRLRLEGIDASIVLYIAEPGTAIARAAEIDHADLIVMTAHPRWKSDFLDNSSTTLQVLARSRIPILAWRSGAGRQAARDVLPEAMALASMESPIVVPLDGSPFAEAALPVAEDMARRCGSYLVLVQAVPDGRIPGSDTATLQRGAREKSSDEEVARGYLERVKQDLATRGIGAEVIVHRGTPTHVIDAVWREQNGSLIIMASHGASGVARSFLGSVTARTIEDVGAPVLVVRPETEIPPDPYIDARVLRIMS